jgi:hypothetical protein
MTPVTAEKLRASDDGSGMLVERAAKASAKRG